MTIRYLLKECEVYWFKRINAAIFFLQAASVWAR